MPRLSFHDAVFVVTEEHNCPIHNVGDEFIIHGSKLNVTQYQGTCLFLMPTLLSVLTQAFSRSSQPVSPPKVQQVKFECDGCSGLLRFEYEKKYSTPQGRLIDQARKWAGNRIIQNFFPLLRETELFKSLNDNELQNLILTMELQKHSPNRSIIRAGEQGSSFYVILSGNVIVRDDCWGVIAELGPGDFFGEMSLISGEPTYPSVDSKTDIQLATLNVREFNRVITTWHELFFFLCRIIAFRSGKNIILPYSETARPLERKTDHPAVIPNKPGGRIHPDPRRWINNLTVQKIFRVLRRIMLFESLNDANLKNLALHMILKSYPSGRSIIKSGNRVSAFYVILSGNAVTKDNKGEITGEIGAGDFFGEMSLLTDEPSYSSVYSKTAVQLAVLESEEFRHTIKKYPNFLKSLCRFLVTCSREVLKRDVCMIGELAEISSMDLFQMVNSASQSGKINFILDQGHGVILFNKGEIVHCNYNNEQEGKEAFFTLLRQQKGRFTQNSILSEEERELQPLGDFMRLLMEGTQHLDEDEDRDITG